MRLHRALGLALPMAMTLALGCKDTVPEPAPSATATATAALTATAAPTATSHAADHGKRRWRGGRGIAGMMFRAAHDLDLKDEQKATIEKLAEQLRGALGPRPEMKEMHTTLVAQVRAGKIDTAKLEPFVTADDKAREAQSDKEAEALNGLYAALEPAQRKALVASVRAKLAAHADKEKAHADKEKKVDEGDPTKRRLEHLTKQADLDAAQQKKIEPLLAKSDAPTPEATRDEMKKHTEAVLAAFEADGFDAKKLAPPGGKKSPLAAHLQLLAAIVPILKPEQREKLASSLETMPGNWHDGPHAAPEPHEEEAPPAQ